MSDSSDTVEEWTVAMDCSPWTVARQSPASMGFSRQEYWSGLPCPPPGDLPDPEVKPPALQADSLPLSYQGVCFLGICCLSVAIAPAFVSPQPSTWLLACYRCWSSKPAASKKSQLWSEDREGTLTLSGISTLVHYDITSCWSSKRNEFRFTSPS